MTATEQFIRDAIEGGWAGDVWMLSHRKTEGVEVVPNDGYSLVFYDELQTYVQAILLDPAAWRAVGKVRGWAFTERRQCGGYNTSRETKRGLEVQEQCSHCQMHRLIDALAEEKSVEEYLATI